MSSLFLEMFCSGQGKIFCVKKEFFCWGNWGDSGGSEFNLAGEIDNIHRLWWENLLID
jgi:hypothetical protein